MSFPCIMIWYIGNNRRKMNCSPVREEGR